MPFSTDALGHEQMSEWFQSHGHLVRVGIEATGNYGAGVTRYLINIGLEVVEVIRPNRQSLRRFGKTDVTDALAYRSRGAGRAQRRSYRRPQKR